MKDNQTNLFILAEQLKSKYLYSLILDYQKENIDILAIYPYFNINLKPIDYSDPQEYTPENISEFYLDTLSQEEKNNFGRYFTCSNILKEQLLCNLELSDGDILTKKFLEPAVGCGSLILPIIKKYVELSSNLSPRYALENLKNNYYFIDISKSAIDLTEISILFYIKPLIVKALNENSNFRLEKLNVLTGDYLLLSNNLPFDFDFIIGNPPFITMYGRRSKGMNEEKRKYYNQNFDFVRNKLGNNKFNLSMFFIELGIKNLELKGKLCFILDIAFFETAYIDIRKYILETCIINAIDLDYVEFKDVASGQFLLTIQKESNFFSRQENTLIWRLNGTTKQQKQYFLYNEQENYKFCPPLNDSEQEFINKLNNLPKLSSICKNKELRTCCALTGKTEQFMSSDPTIETVPTIPYLEGSKGITSRYCTPKFSNYIKLDYSLQLELSNQFKEELEKKGVKNKKRVTLGDRDAYYYPKVFIRQSSSELIATYTEQPYAANNSLYILSFKSFDKQKTNLLKYLCGLINSSVLSEYALITGIIRKGKGKTPQIKISDLLKLPIIISETYYNLIIEEVDKILVCEDKEQKYSIYKKIDSVVTKVYNLKG